MLLTGLEKLAINWGSVGQGAMRVGLPGAGLGAIAGAAMPGQDAEGHRRGRLSGALHGAVGGGLTGAAMGGVLGALPAGAGAAAAAPQRMPAQLMGHAGDMPDLATMKRGAFNKGVRAAALKYGL